MDIKQNYEIIHEDSSGRFTQWNLIGWLKRTWMKKILSVLENIYILDELLQWIGMDCWCSDELDWIFCKKGFKLKIVELE